MGPRTYLEPGLEPGVHFHRLPDLATMQGDIIAWDAGNPSADDRKEAGEVEAVGDVRGMAAAIVQEVDGAVIARTVVLGPALSQEGVALSMNTAIKSAHEATGLPPPDLEHSIWGDSQAAEAATEAYVVHPKAHCMMSRLAYQVHEGKHFVMTRPLNIVITPSHRFTSGNRGADKTVLQEHDLLGHNLLRRPFNFAPPEVQGDHYQLGPSVLGRYLQRKDTAALDALHEDNFGP